MQVSCPDHMRTISTLQQHKGEEARGKACIHLSLEIDASFASISHAPLTSCQDFMKRIRDDICNDKI
jgi:hypothetical protein